MMSKEKFDYFTAHCQILSEICFSMNKGSNIKLKKKDDLVLMYSKGDSIICESLQQLETAYKNDQKDNANHQTLIGDFYYQSAKLIIAGHTHLNAALDNEKLKNYLQKAIEWYVEANASVKKISEVNTLANQNKIKLQITTKKRKDKHGSNIHDGLHFFSITRPTDKEVKLFQYFIDNNGKRLRIS